MDGAMRDTHFESGYCGALLGVTLRSSNLLHASADVLIGGGSVSQIPDYSDNRHDNDWDDDSDYASDEYFMAQPMAHVELNVFRWMRVNAGAGYRFVDGVSRFGLENSDVSGPVAGLGFRFGKF
jgi:hypothetical protein